MSSTTSPPTDLLVDIMNAAATLAAGAPEIVSLLDSAVTILKTGVVTPEQEAAIRAQLNATKTAIDAA